MSAPLQEELSRFYARWHALEATLGKDAGSVLDFDVAPRVPAGPPFADRLEALRALGALRERVEAERAGLANPAYLAAKLDGSETYLRALMGERFPIDSYLRRTMGCAPEPISDAEVRRERDALAEGFGRLGVPYAPEGRPTFLARLGYGDRSGFGDSLRAHAVRWVARVREALGIAEAPEYRVEDASEDAYWSAWIDGSLEGGVRLRVNRHPRIDLFAGADLRLAAHEIAGHAVHVAALRASAREGRLDAATLNLTVHACEAFQMEGLAQTVLPLWAEPGEVSPELELLERHGALRSEVVNRAQLEVEAGRPVDEAFAQVTAACPLANPLSVLSDLRDRGRNPLFRCYSHVYAPSRRLFLRARALPEAARRDFLRRAYAGLYTPAQLAALLDGWAPQPIRSP